MRIWLFWLIKRVKNENELILQYEIISENLYVHFICAEESKNQELKGYNIIGHVPEILFKVLLWKLLYGNFTFFY